MSVREPRLSHQTLKVFALLLEAPREPFSGADIVRRTGMLSGTLYPILMRLEKAGWLTSKWEELDPAAVGRPRKRLYRLTGLGYNKARAALRELTVLEGSLLWNS